MNGLTRRPCSTGLRIATISAVLAVGLSQTTVHALSAQDWLAFRSTLGHEWLSDGDLSVPLNGDTRSEWSVLLHPAPPTIPGRLRLGAGISRVTYEQNPGWPIDAPHPIRGTHDTPRWNHVRWHVLLGIELIQTSFLDLYVERRRVWGRLRSERHVKWPITDDPPRRTPYDEWGVRGWETAVGVKTDLNGLLPFHVDALYRMGNINPRDIPSFDLANYGLGNRQGAQVRGIQIGVYWDP